MSRTKKIILRVVLGLAGIVAALYIADHTYTAVSNYTYHHDDPVDQIGIPMQFKKSEFLDSVGHDCSVSYYFCRVPKPDAFYEDGKFRFQQLGGYKAKRNGAVYEINDIKFLEFPDWKAYSYQINPQRIFACSTVASCKRTHDDNNHILTGRLSFANINNEEVGSVWSTKGLTNDAIGWIDTKFNKSGELKSGEPFLSFIYATVVVSEDPKYYHVALIQEKNGRILEVKFEHSCGAQLRKDMAQLSLILRTLEIKSVSAVAGK